MELGLFVSESHQKATGLAKMVGRDGKRRLKAGFRGKLLLPHPPATAELGTFRSSDQSSLPEGSHSSLKSLALQGPSGTGDTGSKG